MTYIHGSLENTAYHEAGHYVFEVYYNSKDILDTQPYSITIKPNEDYLGQVASEGDGLETGIVNSDQMVKAVIIKSLAGYACEKIIDPNRSDEPLGAEEDFDYSKRLLKRWNPVNKTLDNLITEAISLAGKLWPGIDLIANELLVKKTISGLELEILELKVQAILGLIDKKEASKIIKGLEQFR